MLAGVLGAQPAAALGLVEPGPLDRRRRAVGHQLQQLEVARLEAVVHARAHLHDADDLAPHEQRGGHERRHPLAQQRWRSAAASATSLTMTAWARDATSPTTPSPTRTSRPSVDAGVEAVRGPDRRGSAVRGHEEDGGHVAAHHPPGPGQQLVEQGVEREEGQAGVGDRLDRAQGHAGVVEPEADPALGHPAEDQDDEDHDRSWRRRTATPGCASVIRVRKWKTTKENRAHADDQGGLAQERVAAEGLAQQAVGLGPVVVGDDGGGIGRGGVPAGGARPPVHVDANNLRQAPHAP